MYYQIDKIRSAVLNSVPITHLELKNQVKKFTSTKNLIDLEIFKKIYTNNSSLYIDEESFLNYMKKVLHNFGLEPDFNKKSKISVHDYDELFIIDSFKDIIKLEEQRDKICTQRNQNRKKNISFAEKPLPIDIENKKIVSIDFEFLSNKVAENIPREMGISIQKDDEVKYFNYSFVNNEKNRFNFGDTIFADPSETLKIFKEHCVGADYLIGHNIPSEIIALKNVGLEESFFENIEIIDTSYVTKNEFHFLNSDHVENETASLRTSLRTLDIPYIRLHVAGNDSAYTLAVFNKLVQHKINFKNKDNTQKIKIESTYQNN